MRPIELTLSGLQSYRELQMIDFEKLCENGLFGIFGPTGSGKSTILDAITLALFGKVERALNGTQGIMNQAENQLTVSFSFQLNGAQGSQRYRVERRFKRTGDNTISNTVSRFIEIEEQEERVLADKLSDVNRLVEQTIGLKMDDFTRAVVLPQGKFAEFLSLKGSDRRQMLQRLFSLERYGDELMVKLSRRAKETEANVNTCVAEQQGLGDASADAVAQVEHELAEAMQRHGAARAAKEAVEARYKSLQELRAWQQERAAVEAKLLEQEGEAASVAVQEQQLRLAVEAERLQPLIVEAEAAQLALQQEQQRLLAAGEARASTAAKLEHAAGEAQHAKHTREQREPVLLNGIEHLGQALDWQRNVLLQQAAADQAAADMKLAEQQEQVAEAEQQRLNQLLARAVQRQAELKQLLRGAERTLDERERSQAAWHASERLKEQQVQLAMMEAQQREQQEQLTSAEREQQAALRHVYAWRDKIPSWSAKLDPIELEAVQLEHAARSLANDIEAGSVWLNQQLREMTKRALAIELSDTLADGEPCPVCGSLVHQQEAAQQLESTPFDKKYSEEERSVSVNHYREWILLVESQLGRWSEMRDQVREGRSLLVTLQDRSKQLKGDFLQKIHAAEERIRSFGSWIGDSLEQLVQVVHEDHSQQQAAAIQRASAVSGSENVAHAANEQSERGTQTVSVRVSQLQTEIGIESVIQQATELLLATEQRCDSMQTMLQQLGTESDRLVPEKIAMEQQLEQSVWALQQASVRCQSQHKAYTEVEQNCKGQQERYEQLRDQYEQLYSQWALTQIEALRERWMQQDRDVENYRERLERGMMFVEETQAQVKQQEELRTAAVLNKVKLDAEFCSLSVQLQDLHTRLAPLLAAGPLEQQLQRAESELAAIKQAAELSVQAAEAARQASTEAAQSEALALQAHEAANTRHKQAAEQLQVQLASSSFALAKEALTACLNEATRRFMEERLAQFNELRRELQAQLRRLDELLQQRSVSAEAWAEAEAERTHALAEDEASFTVRVKLERDAEQLRSKHVRWMELEARRAELQIQLGRLQQLQAVFRGNAFVEYIAEEQLLHVSRDASVRLKLLTKQRYALEVDSGGGFVIRDDGNGGIRRPVSTLSGGETFLTSLALALALSAQIQLRGMYPLEFFFLDEGFGTLDPELLDTVVSALEKLHSNHLAVGVISHVPELRARLPRKLIVEPAEQAGRGSSFKIEMS